MVEIARAQHRRSQVLDEHVRHHPAHHFLRLLERAADARHEPSFGRRNRLAPLGGKSPQKLFLGRSEVVRCVDDDGDDEVAPAPALEVGDSLAAQPGLRTALAAGGNGDFLRPLEGLHFERCPKGSLCHRRVDSHPQVVAVPHELRVRSNPQVKV